MTCVDEHDGANIKIHGLSPDTYKELGIQGRVNITPRPSPRHSPRPSPGISPTSSPRPSPKSSPGILPNRAHGGNVCSRFTDESKNTISEVFGISLLGFDSSLVVLRASLGLAAVSVSVISYQHVYGLVVLVAFLGLAAGVAYPGIHVVLAKWSPCSEKSRLSAIVFAGTQLGSVVSQAVAGLLSDTHFLGGWPSVFYTMGVFGCGLAVIWMLVISESPGEHPNISGQEREYIEKTAKPISKKLKTPWGSLLRSVPFWAIGITRLCNLWGMFTLFSYLPRYIEQVLHFDTKENGLLSALPYLACWMFIMVAGFLSDSLRKKHMSTKNVRKLMTTAGVLYGLSNGAASVSGFVAPYLVGYILEEKVNVLKISFWKFVKMFVP
ncbi:sialin-like [Liolophura sinensis]|uniref:sialin-like n=1 Tax=Liolophura sinensis TaxID=3198878 RepID=UPI003157F5C4